MKKTLFNICGCLLLMAVSTLSLTSCEKDDDSNPTLNTDNLSMTLLTPALGQNNVLDLSASETVNLKIKEQPQYGYPAIVKYSVQVSIDPAFVTAAPTDATVKYQTLGSTYTTASMNVDAMEINNAVIKLYQSANNNEDPTGKVIAMYTRVRAAVVTMAGDEIEGTECYSNVVTLPKIQVAYVAQQPTTLYMTGTTILDGSGAKAWAPVYGFAGCFYTLAYFDSNATFKYGDSEDASLGYDATTSIDDQAGAGIDRASDGSISVANAGWYVLYLSSSVDKAHNALINNLAVYPPKAYVIGNATDDTSWADSNEAWAMTASADASGEWESPAFVNSGELRAYIKVQGIDWWRTEFTLLKGDLFWRTVDIPANWNDNLGSAYSVQCEPGQRLYVNFDKCTGYVK